MGNNQHLKRHSAPVAWPIKRKNITFVAKPNSGSHKENYVVPVVVLVRDVLNYAETSKEVKQLINAEEILVNGKVVKDIKFPVGLFDTISFKTTTEKYNVLLDTFGKIKLVATEDDLSFLKVAGKTKLKAGKLQLNFMNGYNLIVDEKTFATAKVEDTVVFDFAKKAVLKVLNLVEGSMVYFFDGKFKGQIGEVKEFEVYNGLTKDIIKVQIGEEVHSTAKDYAYVVGAKKADAKRFE